MTVLAGAIAVAAWVYLLAGRGGFWLFRDVLASGHAPTGRRVAAVIPARNEAEGIARTVRSLLTQRFDGALHVFVVDDHSTDNTAALAREAALEACSEGRLTVILGEPLPAGWTGKLWAVKQGVGAAGALTPDFILLTDGDIEHAPNSVASLVARAERDQLDLTSVMVRLHAEHAAEALLIPAFVFFFFKLYPPSWTARAGYRTAGAAGGCMLVRPAALERIGGIAAIRAELIDDCALARAIKQTGGRIWLGLSAVTRSMREYRSLGEIRDMVARTAYTQLRYSPLLLAGTVVGMSVIYLAAPIVALFTTGAARLLGVAAWLLMSIAFAPALRFYGKTVIMAPLLPVAAAFYVEATIASALRFYGGVGGQWKGRTAASARSEAE